MTGTGCLAIPALAAVNLRDPLRTPVAPSDRVEGHEEYFYTAEFNESWVWRGSRMQLNTILLHPLTSLAL